MLPIPEKRRVSSAVSSLKPSTTLTRRGGSARGHRQEWDDATDREPARGASEARAARAGGARDALVQLGDELRLALLLLEARGLERELLPRGRLAAADLRLDLLELAHVLLVALALLELRVAPARHHHGRRRGLGGRTRERDAREALRERRRAARGRRSRGVRVRAERRRGSSRAGRPALALDGPRRRPRGQGTARERKRSAARAVCGSPRRFSREIFGDDPAATYRGRGDEGRRARDGESRENEPPHRVAT